MRVHYGKYCTRAWSRANKARGAAECFICPRPRPECYIFHNARARTVL